MVTCEFRVVYNNLPQLRARAQRECHRLVAWGILNVQTRARMAILSGNKTGRTYRRGKVTRKRTAAYAGSGLRGYKTKSGTPMVIVGATFHRASARGEAPASDTGYLANNIGAMMVGQYTGITYVSAGYAAILEGPMDRPFLGPAVEAVRKPFLDGMRRIVMEGTA
jgi:hypothetical protein